MNIYKITQTTIRGWDTYSAAVVIAATASEAITIHPASENPSRWYEEPGFDFWNDLDGRNFGWCRPRDVTATYIGTTYDGTPPGVVLASLHAG